MSMRLKNEKRGFPGGHRFRHPISGHEESFHAWNLLRDWVTAHCRANGYPPISDIEIQTQQCERLDPVTADRYCEGEGNLVRGTGLNWREVWAGTKVLASFLLAGKPLVSKDEANRRASICARCPRNVTFHKPCGGLCGELREAVTAIVGEQTTHFDDRLDACSVCGCSNSAQVWIPIEQLKLGVSEEMMGQFVDFCWKKAGIEELAAKDV